MFDYQIKEFTPETKIGEIAITLIQLKLKRPSQLVQMCAIKSIFSLLDLFQKNEYSDHLLFLFRTLSRFIRKTLEKHEFMCEVRQHLLTSTCQFLTTTPYFDHLQILVT